MNNRYTSYPSDGKEILRVLESSPAKGSIQLLYTRRPDGYASFGKEAGEGKVFVLRDNQKIVGTCGRITRKAYIDGVPTRTSYICAFKKDASYNGNARFGHGLAKEIISDNADIYYCSVVGGNGDIQRSLSQSRRLINALLIGEYTTYILSPRFKLKTCGKDYTFRQAKKNDLPRILEFMVCEGSKRAFFPAFDSLEELGGLGAEDFYLLEKDGVILSLAALWDRTDCKQYVVKKYGGLTKYARFFNPILYLLGYIKLPEEDVPLRFPFLSFFLCKDDNPDYCKAFLNSINGVVRKKYGMYVVGVPKNHFSVSVYKKLKSISFDSKIYAIGLCGKKAWVSENVKNTFYPECALL